MPKISNIDLGGFPVILAPMEDVSDPPFRAICKEKGADLVFTEFISVEGLIRDARKSFKKLDIYSKERPVGIQIFGSELNSMVEATKILTQTKPDIIDINFGCPVKKIVNKGAGAGILKDIPKMVELTKAVVENTDLPVTVKTRLGWDENSIQIVEVAERLQDVGIKAISIHGRTRSQMYKGRANWEKIAEVKNNPRMKIPVFGNGDVNSPEKAKKMRDEYGLDGAMIGRASIGNPWIFEEIKHYFKTGEILPLPSIEERIRVAKLHLQKSIEWKGERTGIMETRYHYTNYLKGIRNIKPYRIKLLQSYNLENIYNIFEEIKLNFQ